MRRVKLIDWLLALNGEEEQVIGEDNTKPPATKITSNILLRST